MESYSFAYDLLKNKTRFSIHSAKIFAFFFTLLPILSENVIILFLFCLFYVLGGCATIKYGLWNVCISYTWNDGVCRTDRKSFITSFHAFLFENAILFFTTCAMYISVFQCYALCVCMCKRNTNQNPISQFERCCERINL